MSIWFYTQQDPIGIAGGLNLYGFANGDPVNFSDPFGLCPPEDDNFDDCERGSSEYYAARIARGEGNRLVNEVAGALATCGESIDCLVSMVPLGAVGGAVGRAGQALKAAAGGEVAATVGSVLETQIAGRLWVGLRGAGPIVERATGALKGLKNAAATRIFRFAEVKGAGHFHAGELVANLVDKLSGSNTHLIVKRFIPF